MIPTIVPQQEENLATNSSIVIVGAGIIGLDVAFALSERGFGPCITVMAEYLPGDIAPLYTSLWVGCNYSGLTAEKGDEAYVVRTPSIEFWDEGIYGNKLDDIRDYLEDKNLGVTFVQQKLPHIHTPLGSKETRLVFNCTGNVSQEQLGVGDSNAPQVKYNIIRHGKDYFTHVIPRPMSDALVRTRQLCKELDQQPFEVLGAFAGLRPSRQGRPRIEREEIIAGYGMATDAVNKAQDLLSEILSTTSSNIGDYIKV
ncbi:FAD dependent oxidoreductase [Trichoderma compactum]